jgi:hypothetical protein
MAIEKLTINELMALMKTVRERVNSLKPMRQSVAMQEKNYWKVSGEIESVNQPQYDVKKVDKKIMELENFLFRADAKIKTTNARTRVDFDVDIEELLKPLE